MGSLPGGSELVAIVADPPVRVDVPSTVLPEVKVTVPVGPDDRVAVKITDCPGLDGLSEEAKPTVGVALFTVWVVDPVAGLLLVSPP
jgi:hypothetical protein